MRKILAILAISLILITACKSQTSPRQILSDNPTEIDDLIEEETEEKAMFLTTMTHMEGGHTDDKKESVFNMHIEQIRYGMDLADEYGAKLTFESEKPFARANTIWDHNMMQEILDREHGVGTHCDIGAKGKMDYDDFVAELKENKDLVDDLVGEENNKGCSGAGGPNDWVQGLLDAGFAYVDGIVGFHLLAFDEEARVDGWSDQYISSTAFHYSVPQDYLGRLEFIQLEDLDSWEDDGEGLVISNGEYGKLSHMEEGSWEECGGRSAGNDCPLDLDDVDALVEMIMMLDEGRDHSEYGKITIYFPLNDWIEKNETVLRYFFSEMERLQAEGIIQWATQLEAVDAYLAD